MQEVRLPEQCPRVSHAGRSGSLYSYVTRIGNKTTYNRTNYSGSIFRLVSGGCIICGPLSIQNCLNPDRYRWSTFLKVMGFGKRRGSMRGHHPRRREAMFCLINLGWRWMCFVLHYPGEIQIYSPEQWISIVCSVFPFL